MKTNQNIVLYGERVVLVPYEEHHVPKYHEWMKSEELQKLTASEPLSLEEEYAMQKSWREDENKCTFIILNKEVFSLQNEKAETDAMVGDVNLFFNEDDDSSSAEIEIMIAEPDARGKGMGKEALFSMLRYGLGNILKNFLKSEKFLNFSFSTSVEELKIRRFTAKIGYENTPSQSMFKKIGFTEISRSDVFKEVTLELIVTDIIQNQINKQTASYRIDVYR